MVFLVVLNIPTWNTPKILFIYDDIKWNAILWEFKSSKEVEGICNQIS